MSAVEALAEVLRDHWPMYGSNGWRCGCGEGGLGQLGFPAHQSEALVAAIRSMPAEQVAELIDGTVERDPDFPAGCTCDGCADRLGAFSTRVVGPWLPLGVSPETNGEG